MAAMRGQGSLMDQMMGGAMNPFGDRDPFSLLRSNIAAIPSSGQDGHFQSFQSSYCSTSDGKNPPRVIEHTRSLRRAPGQVAEMKERRSDTGAGKQQMAVQRQIGNRAVRASRACDMRTNQAHQDASLLNMTEADAPASETEWYGASKALPSERFARGGGGMGGMGGMGSDGMGQSGDFFGRQGGGHRRGNAIQNPAHQHGLRARNRQQDPVQLTNNWKSIPRDRAPQIATPGAGTPLTTGRSTGRGNRSGMLALGQ